MKLEFWYSFFLKKVVAINKLVLQILFFKNTDRSATEGNLNSRKFEFSISDDGLVQQIEMDGEATVYFGSPFYGMPKSARVDSYYLMDTNVYSYICKDKYPKTVLKFLSVAKDCNFELNPSFAIAEQYRSAPNAKGFAKYFQGHLKNRFGIAISDSKLDQFCSFVEGKNDASKSNVELIENYLSIIKKIYNTKSMAPEKISEFLTFISDKNLPHFSFPIFSGIIFFLIRDSEKCDSVLKKKVNDFLEIQESLSKEKKALHNSASDLSLFINCQEIAAASDASLCTMASIVTCDTVVGHILENLGIYTIENPKNGKNPAQVALRQSSEWLDDFTRYMPLIQEKLARKPGGDEETIAIRKSNLKNEGLLSMKSYMAM